MIDEAVRKLEEELAAWERHEQEREPLPYEAQEITDQLIGRNMGAHGSLERARVLLPLVVRRLREELRSASVSTDAVADALDGAREVLAVMREWFSTELATLDPLEVPSPWEARMERACSRVRGCVGRLGQTPPRFSRDIERLLEDLENLREWLRGFADEARRRPGFAPGPDEKWTFEQWRDYLWESILRREPLIADLEREGLTPASMERACLAAREARHLARRMRSAAVRGRTRKAPGLGEATSEV